MAVFVATPRKRRPAGTYVTASLAALAKGFLAGKQMKEERALKWAALESKTELADEKLLNDIQRLEMQWERLAFDWEKQTDLNAARKIDDELAATKAELDRLNKESLIASRESAATDRERGLDIREADVDRKAADAAANKPDQLEEKIAPIIRQIRRVPGQTGLLNLEGRLKDDIRRIGEGEDAPGNLLEAVKKAVTFVYGKDVGDRGDVLDAVLAHVQLYPNIYPVPAAEPTETKTVGPIWNRHPETPEERRAKVLQELDEGMD